MKNQVFQQSIWIPASVAVVDQTIVNPKSMRQWLNPALECEALGDWNDQLGGIFRFSLRLPLWRPTLLAEVVERQPGLVVWEFTGFFQGRDRWECHPEGNGTRLLNRFEFAIANPLVAFGFQTFAAPWTRQDMQAQLKRLKQVALVSVTP